MRTTQNPSKVLGQAYILLTNNNPHPLDKTVICLIEENTLHCKKDRIGDGSVYTHNALLLRLEKAVVYSIEDTNLHWKKDKK